MLGRQTRGLCVMNGKTFRKEYNKNSKINVPLFNCCLVSETQAIVGFLSSPLQSDFSVLNNSVSSVSSSCALHLLFQRAYEYLEYNGSHVLHIHTLHTQGSAFVSLLWGFLKRSG